MSNKKRPVYARGTSVSADRTESEIKQLLRDHGATRIGTAEEYEPPRRVVYFELAGRQIRFVLRLPQIEEFATLNRGVVAPRARTTQEQRQAYEQEIARLWRSLLASIKAKLVSIADGIETTEEAFHAHIVMADGQRLVEWTAPQLAVMYESRRMPPLLPGLSGSADRPLLSDGGPQHDD